MRALQVVGENGAGVMVFCIPCDLQDRLPSGRDVQCELRMEESRAEQFPAQVGAFHFTRWRQA
jgi:hypothetical protein